MGEVVIADQVTLPCSASDAFELIAAGGLPPWRLPVGRKLQVGIPVSVPITLPPGLGGQQVEILGRVASMNRPNQVVISHELPWRGTITAKVVPTGVDRCSIRLIGRVAEDLVSWATRFVVPTAPPANPDKTWRIGLLSSASGPASVFSLATQNMATMAVEEINFDGGVLGRQVELVTGDDGTHPGLGAAELVRLAKAGCGVVLANVTSATFRALLPVARRYGVLLLHTLMNEGGARSDEVFRLGERPMAQASAAIPALMRATGGSRFYLAGSDYCWPRVMMGAARQVVERSGGSVGSELYLPMGTTDFSRVISDIDRNHADLVVSTFVGADEVAFEQQMHAAGLGERVQTVSFVLDESTHEYIGPEASAGLWTVFSYFEALPSAENRMFLARYRARFGTDAPPASSLSECVYEAVHLVARAIAGCRDLAPLAIVRQLRDGVEFNGPRGRVDASWRGVRQAMYVAHSQRGQLSAVEKVVTHTI
ncbi:MAG TPA: substrate-binding protein [Nocardioides sp.]|uniref:substrate-binding protein n=1 Tax=uncultured Nocardioides sp. TaxID=198441 RepID=UPI0026233592|nr:substrate-binding protein [uncultured Nocardioides sp.]HRI94129.1 substrate-binding protein [Nocardioides sp.]